MNRKDYPRDQASQYRRPPRFERQSSRDTAPSSRLLDGSGTGRESQYLNSLVETACELVIVLRQGDCLTGQLAWYDQTCVKLTPSDGSPSLLIPKTSIKYLYEGTRHQAVV